MREDQNVAHVEEDEFVQHVSEYITDEALEHSRGVGKAKRHHKVLIMTRGGIEGCFTLLHWTESSIFLGHKEETCTCQ